MRAILKDIIFIVGLLVMAALALIAFGGIYFDVRGIYSEAVAGGLRADQLAFLGLTVVFFIVVGRLLWRLRKLEAADTRPRFFIDTPDEVLGTGEYTVNVRNDGVAAEVEALFRVIGGGGYIRDRLREYTGCWERSNTSSPLLRQGQFGRLRVAKLVIEPMGGGAICNYILHYWDEVRNGPHELSTTSWPLPKDTAVSLAINLELTITADPSPVDGAVVRYYRLDEGGLFELQTRP